jgi:hypothetical protein
VSLETLDRKLNLLLDRIAGGRWLSRKAAAAYGDVSLATLKRWIADGRFTAGHDKCQLGAAQGLGLALPIGQVVEEADYQLGRLLAGHLLQRRYHALGLRQL